jgi:hypothetical protein
MADFLGFSAGLVLDGERVEAAGVACPGTRHPWLDFGGLGIHAAEGEDLAELLRRLADRVEHVQPSVLRAVG